MDGFDVLVQAAFFSKLFVAIGTNFRNDIAMQSQMPGVTFLLQSQSANRTAGHLGCYAKVMQHVTHQGFVVFEHFGAKGAHQFV